MRLRARTGIALVAALGLMTLLGLMVAGAFAASLIGERASRLTQSDATLNAAVDYAITTVLGDPSGRGLADLPLGQARSFVVPVPSSANVVATVAVTRLPAGVLWLVVDAGVSGVDQGHRRLNIVARFPVPGASPLAAIVARGNVVARDSVSFGTDLGGDPDCAVGGTLDVITSTGATVFLNDSTRTGALPIAGDSATYYMKSWQAAMLDSMASVVHVHGDTIIAGGAFTGIMLVDGSITVTRPFAVTGLVVARGSISATAGGFSSSGAVMAFGSPARGGTAIELAHATIRYAPCAIANAFKHAVAPRPVLQRSWAELF